MLINFTLYTARIIEQSPFATRYNTDSLSVKTFSNGKCNSSLLRQEGICP